jgi:putative transposase
MVNTVASTIKIKIPNSFSHILDNLQIQIKPIVERMLKNRQEDSSKYYKGIPSVITKSLIAKYQKNKKCKTVSNLIIPICGDKERQIRFVDVGVRIPALFGKEILPLELFRPCSQDDKGRRNISAEFFKRGGEWYGAFSYKTPAESKVEATGFIGVDRNAVGHVATMSDPQNGKVFHLGFDPSTTKRNWKGRKAKLQSKRKNRLLFKLKRKQSRRTKHENHIVSKVIVDYAAKHRRVIVLEDLSNVRKEGSKIKSYVEKSQWSFFQLEQFIRYKAALRGVEVVLVQPAYTSQDCSRCGTRNKPNGKKYICSSCGHEEHRDANAGFNIAYRAVLSESVNYV